MLLWLGEGRWWGEGCSSDPAIAVERGREGVSSGVCWWGYVHWFGDRREGGVTVGGAGSTLLHLRMQGTCCSSYMLYMKGWVVQRRAGCPWQCLGTYHAKWEKILGNSGSP